MPGPCVKRLPGSERAVGLHFVAQHPLAGVGVEILLVGRQHDAVGDAAERHRVEHHRGLAVLDPPDAVLHLLVRILAAVAQPEVVVGEIHAVVLGDDDVVRAAEALAVVRPARQLRARVPSFSRRITARSLSAHQMSAPLRIEAGAARADEQHVRAPGARLGAGVVHVGARVARLLEEHRHGLVGRHLVDHVVEQAADEQVARVALAHPHRAFVQAEAGRQQLGRGVGSTISSSAGSERVMLNGFAAGAGPSPRMVGAGVPDCARTEPAETAAIART